jgi:hypothetical protein
MALAMKEAIAEVDGGEGRDSARAGAAGDGGAGLAAARRDAATARRALSVTKRRMAGNLRLDAAAEMLRAMQRSRRLLERKMRSWSGRKATFFFVSYASPARKKRHYAGKFCLTRKKLFCRSFRHFFIGLFDFKIEWIPFFNLY